MNSCTFGKSKVFYRGFEKTPEIIEKGLYSADSSLVKILSIVPSKRRFIGLTKEDLFESNHWKRMVVEVSSGDSRYILKCFSPSSFARKLFYGNLVGDPLAKSYRLAESLHKIEVKTPRVLAYGYSLSSGFLSKSFQIIEPIQKAVLVAELIQEEIKNVGNVSQYKKKCAEHFAFHLAQMHNRGFYHLDIKPAHLFVSDPQVGEWNQIERGSEWIWLDLEEAFIQKVHNRKAAITNLSAIWRFFIKPMNLCDLDEFICLYNVHAKPGFLNVLKAKREIEKNLIQALIKSRDIKYCEPQYYDSAALPPQAH